ncbi:CLUMA_CG000430, isoform A [Clunio marinus]|uniref:CLUMA_CG000430, isoform A n=1 Tax=Clunio marinus TaxID=568069 RepID=A0A1J1HJQ3_9DIPT|nr:CLUMA_CG000430, isoform A [Clunio marinus]
MKNVKAETKLDGLPKITSTIKSVLEPQQLKSSKMPYADKRYGLTVYNPPPNELGFLGGLGKRTGNVRSKAHIQRPSMNQILFKMRTANKILVSFSEDPIMSNSFITTQQLKKSPKLPIKTNKKDLNQKISQIQIADNVIKVSKGFKGNSTTSETERYLNAESKKKVEVVVAETKKSKGLSFGAMKKLSILSALKKEEVKESVEEVQSFRAWAMAEREKRHEALQQVSSQQIKQEREANEFFPKVKRRPKTYLGMSKRDRGLLPGAEHLGGYLYGGFIEDSGPDATMLTQTKFNVPYTMFSRAQVESKVRAMSRKKIQSARLEYMKIPQIPSDSENSDDIYEDIKGLSLVRTPYFSIPTITTTKVKRVERLRSKYLKGNRLKRINLLLFDRKLSAEKYREKYASSENDFMSFQTEVEERNENDVEGKKTIEQQLLDTSTSSNCLPLMEIKANVRKTFDSEYRQRYHDFLTEKYLEKLEQYNKNLDQKLIAYENREMQPSALSVHNPEKGMKIMKNYTSLMRSQSNIRKRLQVNAPAFEEERCGTKEMGSFYHRLATEWDPHYEDLMNLFAKQEIENEMINKTTKFIKACEPQFQQLQNNSFEKAKEKLKLIDTVTVKTNELQETLRNRKDQMDLLMQKLMFDERRWESIMMMQGIQSELLLVVIIIERHMRLVFPCKNVKYFVEVKRHQNINSLPYIDYDSNY